MTVIQVTACPRTLLAGRPAASRTLGANVKNQASAVITRAALSVRGFPLVELPDAVGHPGGSAGALSCRTPVLSWTRTA